MDIPLGLKIPEPMRPFMAAYFRNDASGMADCFASDAQLWRVQESEPLKGRESIARWLEDFIAMFRQASLHRMKWFVSHGTILSVSELTMELALLGEGKYLVAMAASYELDATGLIRKLRTFVDTEGAIRMTQT